MSLIILSGVVHYEWVEQQGRLLKQKQPPEAVWEEVGEVLLFYGIPAVLLLFAGGWLLLRKALAPITALSQAAESIRLDNLGERLPCRGTGDELDRLTQVFNAMLVRLEDSVSRVREFTLHASHELKTPLCIMRAEIESALRQDGCDLGERELLASQLDEIQRLTKIVDGLTFLAKSDTGQAQLNWDFVRLDELVKESTIDLQVLGRSEDIQIELTACEEITLPGDRHRLRQLLLNIADNAIKYNRPQGRVSISLLRNGPNAELQIVNTGGGIPPESLARVFDRFFRGDPAHGAQIEGCGLGLSIAQSIVKHHGGSIEIASELGKTTTVTVRLPLSRAAERKVRQLVSL